MKKYGNFYKEQRRWSRTWPFLNKARDCDTQFSLAFFFRTGQLTPNNGSHLYIIKSL